MEFIEIARVYGLPTAALIILSIAIWRVLIWTGGHVVDPIVQGHCLFLKAQTSAMESMADRLNAVASDVREIKAAIAPSNNGRVGAHAAAVESEDIPGAPD